MTDFDDFRLRISTGEDGRYCVSADAAGGEGATSEFELPFSPSYVENLVLRVGRPRRVARSSRTVSEVKRAEEFGGNLFETVFSGEIREVFRAAATRADDNQRGLRLVLSLRQAPELIDLPWEFLFDRPFFFGLRPTTPVVRCWSWLTRKNRYPSATAFGSWEWSPVRPAMTSWTCSTNARSSTTP